MNYTVRYNNKAEKHHRFELLLNGKYEASFMKPAALLSYCDDFNIKLGKKHNAQILNERGTK